MDTEIWCPIPGAPKYQASTFGRIKGPQRILKPQPNGSGYWIVSVVFNGQRISKTAHSLVALAFWGPRPEGLDIAHLDCDKSNNGPFNLRYTTRCDNIQDNIRRGVKLGGIAPLLAKDVQIEIRRQVLAGELTVKEAAAKHGVTTATIYNYMARNGGSRAVVGQRKSRGHACDAPTRHNIASRFHAGEKRADLAAEYGVKPITVTNYYREFNR